MGNLRCWSLRCFAVVITASHAFRTKQTRQQRLLHSSKSWPTHMRLPCVPITCVLKHCVESHLEVNTSYGSAIRQLPCHTAYMHPTNDTQNRHNNSDQGRRVPCNAASDGNGVVDAGTWAETAASAGAVVANSAIASCAQQSCDAENTCARVSQTAERVEVGIASTS